MQLVLQYVLQVGLSIAAKACYDPSIAVNVWQHLQNNDSGKEMEIFSTHPANETRYVSVARDL